MHFDAENRNIPTGNNLLTGLHVRYDPYSWHNADPGDTITIDRNGYFHVQIWMRLAYFATTFDWGIRIAINGVHNAARDTLRQSWTTGSGSVGLTVAISGSYVAGTTFQLITNQNFGATLNNVDCSASLAVGLVPLYS